MSQILIVDDEAGMREFLQILLEERGHNVDCAAGVREGLQALDRQPYELVLTDLRMPDGDGLEVLDYARGRDRGTQVIVMTGFATAETAVQAMKLGARDYITKPFQNDALLVQVDKALEVARLESENLSLRRQLADARGLVGRSAPMKRLHDMVLRIAPTRTSVLITGESGTGKELLAQTIHDHSDRADKPFVAVNCGAIPESLIESELFGHTKGAFTGADRSREGLFRAADGGTLFLDEVGELPLQTQVRLLRVLQERKVKAVGAERELEVDVRIIAATNRDLQDEIANNQFREDLYYRLNVIQLIVPPLRDRREDIPLLVQHFVDRFAKDMGKAVGGVSREAMERLMAWRWDGNVRELQNVVERAMTLEIEERIQPESLPPALLDQPASAAGLASALALENGTVDLDALLAEVERNALARALDRSGGNRTEAARLLGITFRSMRYRLAKHGLADDDDA